MTRLTYQQALQQAATLIQRGAAEQALALLQAMRRQAPSDANVLHLQGLALKALGRHEEALAPLREALAAAPDHPALLNNFANVLMALGQSAKAREHYERALRVAPDNADVQRNLALTLAAEGRHDEALEMLHAADALAPGDVRTLTATGLSLSALERVDEAIAVLERALQVKPDHLKALHGLGNALKQRERLDEAAQVLERARALAPDDPELEYSYGNVLFERGEHDAAADRYRAALTLRPDYVDAHVTLNELYWQRGDTARYAASFREAQAAGRRSVALDVEWVRSLVLAARHDEARAVVADALAHHGDAPALLRWQARLHAACGDRAAACAALERARARSDDKHLRQDFVEALILAGEFERADTEVDALIEAQPDDQLSWALRGTLWRLAGDARHGWLHDYERFVRAYTLPVPRGYASLAEFLEALGAALGEMHTLKVQPREQTLRHGTQTPGRLLHKQVPEIQALRAALAEVVEDYIGALPRDAEHPFLGRNSGRFRFSGSWSVRLEPGGFHVNHVHPAGWISSAFYVAVPPSLGTGDIAGGADAGHGGWIQFGQSSLGLGEVDVPMRFVRPEAGMLVLFPSCTWHGTVPFDGSAEDYRMTAPFDAVPA